MEHQSNLEKMVTIQNLSSVFKNKKVFLTGHTGFKGSWFLQTLSRMGANVVGYSLAPQNKTDLYYQINGDALCSKSIIADIQNAELLTNSIVEFAPDFVFHLAAQPLVIASYENPLYTFAVNAQGTANLLEAIKHLPNKCICVCITTDKVYENPETGIPFLETDKLGGHDPYSASKAAAEIIISSFRNSFFSPEKFNTHQKSIASARAGNVIGGGDYADNRIIPDIVKSIENKKNIIIRNPRATRPWQHVIEPIGAYLLLAANMWNAPQTFANAYNFGPLPEDVVTVEQLANMAIQIFGKGNTEIIPNPNLHEAQNLLLNIDKAKNELQWQPIYSAKESIALTIEWYKNNEEASTKCMQLINNYFSLSINDANES